MALVMGTAGHIDHGKTSLVRALTGVDCDRLEEEKRRGITIELGFAHMDLPTGERLGVVDVPGHERFVRNMVAGAAGIDFVLLVIAADESIMPQTSEHVEICSLLGIQQGIVALTKADIVDEELLALAQEEVSAFIKGTFLEKAPIVPVSAVTRQGLDILRQSIGNISQTITSTRRLNIPRLPVDRVFSMKGHGTVVTGTLISGVMQSGQDIEILPSGLPSRIRTMQSHGQSLDKAQPGQRLSINVHGLDVEHINRGDVITSPKSLLASRRWIMRIRCLSSSPRPLRNRGEVRFHHGTREVPARLYFFHNEKLQPGESALAEVRFSEPMVGVFGDSCVLRNFSPMRTVGGGVLLHPLELAPSRRHIGVELRKMLFHLPEAGAEDQVLTQLHLAGVNGMEQATLVQCLSFEDKALEKCLQQLSARGSIACFDKEKRHWLHGQALEKLMANTLALAKAFHEKEPLKVSMSKGVLLQGLNLRLGHFIVEKLLRSGRLVAEGDGLRLAQHSVVLAAGNLDVKAQLLAAHLENPFAPPALTDILTSLGLDAKGTAPVLRLLQEEGSLVKLKEGQYYGREALNEIKAKLSHWFESHEDIGTTEFRDLCGGLSRKFVIGLLEYFDKERLTLRVGDKRQWRGTKV